MNALNEKISKIGVVPVIKLNHPERDAAGLAKALCAGGVPVAEVTFRAAGADKAIRIMKETCPEMLVGAGTVTNTAQIDAVIEAGGDFIVSPGFDPELVEYAQKKGIPVYPGCTTASEYHQALPCWTLPTASEVWKAPMTVTSAALSLGLREYRIVLGSSPVSSSAPRKAASSLMEGASPMESMPASGPRARKTR